MTVHVRDKLLSKAAEARKHSYSPYSKYAVGAAVVTEDGETFTGCNIENASYSLTICAERTAIFSAVKAGNKKILSIGIVSAGKKPYPCGACLQVLREFADDDCKVHIAADGQIETFDLADLLPKSFTL